MMGACAAANPTSRSTTRSGLTTEAGFVTANVVLWPKVFVLSMSQERFDTLTDEQRAWVTDAAELATQASVDGTYDETTVARELCDEGARFVSADAEQIDTLRSAVAPVIDELAADARERTVARRRPGHCRPPSQPGGARRAGKLPAAFIRSG